MEVKIRTLTPLWTGGVDGEVDRIHETGILGSLRWWMEVLVRGMGGQVKDPTAEKSDDRSSLDPKKFDAKIYRQLQDEAECRQYLRNAGLCDVSQIFGATGWKHRFRLEIQNSQVSDATIKHPISANRTYTDKEDKQPTWYFPAAKSPNAPKTGTFILKIQSLYPDFKPEIIGGLIQFIADWSALGARPQMGFGVIQVEGSRIDTQTLYDWLKQVEGKDRLKQVEGKHLELPSLHNIFLAKIQPKDSNKAFTEEDIFNLKYDLRQLFRAEKKIRAEEEKNEVKSGSKDSILKKDKQNNSLGEGHEDKDLRHFIMGAAPDDKKKDKTEDKRMAAKVKISRPYHENGTTAMRVWGWIPTQSDVYKNGWDREKVINTIHQKLIADYTLQVWREMNSPRDTVTPNENDVQSFLCSLLNPKENSHGNS